MTNERGTYIDGEGVEWWQAQLPFYVLGAPRAASEATAGTKRGKPARPAKLAGRAGTPFAKMSGRAARRQR